MPSPSSRPAPSSRPVTVLSIAGSDPSGGAGIQADLKTFAALGVYGCAVLTALTAQSTRGVSDIHRVPPGFVTQQLDTLFGDITVDAIKIGMLAGADTARSVFSRLRQWKQDNPQGVVVLDPVMVSTSGHQLLADDAVSVIRHEGLGVADLITPNVPESALLLGEPEATSADQLRNQAMRLHELGAAAVLVKGGHLLATSGGQQDLGLADAPPLVTDILLDRTGVHALTGARVDTQNTHGTGCTLSAAVAAQAAQSIHRGEPVDGRWKESADEACAYLRRALRAGAHWRLGAGSGPVDHQVGHESR